MFGDVPKQQLPDFHYRVLDYKEGAYPDSAKTGWSDDYVYRETVRAKKGLEGSKTLLWPGIDLDIPTAPGHSKSTPEGTRKAMMAAFRCRRHSVIPSPKKSHHRSAT